jgi:anti-sigma B factor antagonist
VDLKLGHHARDGIEVIDVQGEIDMYTAPRLRELLIDLVSKAAASSSSTWTRSGSSAPPASGTGRGPEAGAGPRRLTGSGLHATADPEIFRITGLTEVFGIYETADQAIAATKGRR